MSMKIGDLKLGMNGLTIIADVISKSAVMKIREKEYGSAIIGDETAIIKINLWRDQVNQF